MSCTKPSSRNPGNQPDALTETEKGIITKVQNNLKVCFTHCINSYTKKSNERKMESETKELLLLTATADAGDDTNVRMDEDGNNNNAALPPTVETINDLIKAAIIAHDNEKRKKPNSSVKNKRGAKATKKKKTNQWWWRLKIKNKSNQPEEQDQTSIVELEEEDVEIQKPIQLTRTEKARKSRRCRQRYCRARSTRQEAAIQRQERLAIEREDMGIRQRINFKIKQIYGFVPNFLFSPRRNALDYILSCPLSLIQCRPRNLAFHSLCDTKVVPKTLRSLLGLGLNFNIQPPGSSFAAFDLERFLKDYDRRCMFSNAPPDAETAALGPPALYKPNPDWKPELPVSPDLLWRRSNFEMSIRLLFSNHKRNQNISSNLLPNQQAAMK